MGSTSTGMPEQRSNRSTVVRPKRDWHQNVLLPAAEITGRCMSTGSLSHRYPTLENTRRETQREEVFVPVTNAPRRKPGMGCISEINDHLYEGRWSPKWIDGSRISRNVYATTREECEIKLAQLIRKSKIELAELKRAQKKSSKTADK